MLISVLGKSRVVYVKKSISVRAKKRLKWIAIALLLFAILGVILVFVVFPIVFMNSIELQRLIMFTHLNLPSDKSYFKEYELQPGLRNLYVSVKDKSTNSLLSLGVWHLLPHSLEKEVITVDNFDYDKALNNTTKNVLLYFHGTGEDRSSSLKKYHLFRLFFHVITFDYRSYADSSEGELSEDAVVDDCLQLYIWLTKKTSAPIFIWGHSLGTALASKTVSILKSKSNTTQPVGLVLEAPFTKMSDEIYVHPYGKIFAWLPWFKATVVEALEKNGFKFDNNCNIKNVDFPVMILNAEDDNTVPYHLGNELYKLAMKRLVVNTTFYYQYSYKFGYGHNFIYRDSLLPFVIKHFQYICNEM